jgi:hypothetical protein
MLAELQMCILVSRQEQTPVEGSKKGLSSEDLECTPKTKISPKIISETFAEDDCISTPTE